MISGLRSPKWEANKSETRFGYVVRLYLKILNSKPNPNSIHNKPKSLLLQVEEGIRFTKLKNKNTLRILIKW